MVAYAWTHHAGDVQACTPRIRVDGDDVEALDELVWDRGEERTLSLRESRALRARGHYDERRYTLVVDLDTDPVALRRLSSDSELASAYRTYRDRMFPAGTAYRALVSDLADELFVRIAEAPRAPDCFVVIPTRKEIHTVRAVSAIERDCLDSGLEPMFVVLHNDTTDPAVETVLDLERVRADRRAVVFDVRVSEAWTVGEARALLADVCLDAGARLAACPPFVSADADITAISTPGLYARLLRELSADSEVDIVVGSLCMDLKTVGGDRMYAFVREVSELERKIVQKYLAPTAEDSRAIGPCMAVRPLRVPALGGWPRLSVGEDHMLGMKFRKHRRHVRGGAGPMVKLCWTDAEVLVAADRHAHDYRHGPIGTAYNSEGKGSRYLDWESSARRLRPVPGAYPVDPKEAVAWLNLAIDRICRGGTHERVRRALDAPAQTALLDEIRREFARVCVANHLPFGDAPDAVHLSDLRFDALD